jgi:DNA polymerase I
MRAATLPELIRLAHKAGAGFRLNGARVRVLHSQLLAPDVMAELRERRTELWACLGGPEQDAPSLDLLAELGVQAVVPQSETEACHLLAQIEADSERETPIGLLGFDVETAANPGEEVRQSVKISRNGEVVTQRQALDPLPLRRQHRPRSSAGLDPRRSSIRLAQLYGGGEVCLVLDTRLVPLDVLAPIFARRKLVIHNAAFELAFLHARGTVPLPRYECTMQAAGLLLGTHRRALDDAALAVLGIELPKQLQTSDWSADTLSPGQIAYAALDAIIALRLWRLLRLELHAKGRGDAYLLARDAIPAAVRMQARGVGLDQAAHRAWIDDRTAAREAARNALTAETGLPPPEKPAQHIAFLKAALSTDEQEQWPRTVKRRELSTADADLKRMAHIPVIALLRAIKSEEKALSSFGAILAARVARDGRLHASFSVAGAKTGRMRCTAPNIQQCPRDPVFRRCFTAADGHVLVVGDYSSMELRAVAEIAEDPIMRGDFGDPTFDPHRRLAAAINQVTEAEVTSDQRQGAKPINFGTIYGAGPNGLAASAWQSYGLKMTYEEAETARNAFFSRYRTLQAWMRRHADACQSAGVIPIGRCGRVIEAAWEAPPNKARQPWHANVDEDDLWCDEDDIDVDDAVPWPAGPTSPLRYTLCCNAPVQGACADVAMQAMTLIDQAMTEAAIPGGLILAIHDEFVLEVPTHQAAVAARILERCMVQAFAEHFPDAPLTNLVDVKPPAASWGEAKDGGSQASHAPFSPSSAERWIGCPGSIQAEQAAGPSPPSAWADEGTAAHAIFADALRRNVSPYQLTTDPDFAAPLYQAWLWATELIAGRRFLIEQRLTPVPELPDLWGTADVVVFDEHDRVALVLDLKFGRGVLVEADAVQLAIYGLLAVEQFGVAPEGTATVILQPRAMHPAGPVRQHLHSPAALNALRSTLRAAVLAAGDPGAPRIAGPWCRFCAAAEDCPVRLQATAASWGEDKA